MFDASFVASLGADVEMPSNDDSMLLGIAWPLEGVLFSSFSRGESVLMVDDDLLESAPVVEFMMMMDVVY